ncbi:MAG: FecR family protein, partial [Bacteroidales bacterium]
MEKQRLKHLLTNLLAGFPLLSERADIAKWIGSEDAEYDSREAWDNASNNIDSSIKNEIWNNIGIQTKETNVQSTACRRHIPHKSYFYLKVAALVAVILCSTFTLYLLLDNAIGKAMSLDENMYSFEVERGQKGTMRLADGTIVHLNAASKVFFAGNYNSKNRVVNLEGEAYFEVAKNPHKKFIVSCNGIEVEALGTEFNVKAYPSDSLITTTLAKGRVKVYNNKQSITLHPMMLLHI